MLNTILFALVLLLIAPSTRARLGMALGVSLDWISQYQPFSSLVILTVVGAGIFSLRMVRNAPVRVEPPNPMAKYRNEEPLDDEDFH